MLRNRKILLLLSVLVFGALIVGVTRLFQLRFEGGDIYPPYSSLRADPLGVKALYTSLEQVRGVSVRRFYDPLYKLKESSDTTLFVLGADGGDMSWTAEKEAEDLEHFLRGGGRLVVSFFPENAKSWSTGHKERLSKHSSDAKKKKAVPDDGNMKKPEVKRDEIKKLGKGDPKPDPEDKDEMFGKMVSLQKRWNLEVDYKALVEDADGVSEPVIVHAGEGVTKLPATVSWHSAMYFTALGAEWKPIYNRGTNAVVIERPFGKGSLVLVSDSYFLSNEALRKERQSELLAWLGGANRQLIFDETHLGVTQDPGIATLARKYRLHGLICGLVLLAGFFIWKNAVSFVPPHDELSVSQSLLTGKDSAAGFVNLLRRNVPPSEVLSVCFAEWKKSAAKTRSHLQNRIERMEKIVSDQKALPNRQKNPAESYQNIAKILAEKKS